ncbi:MAG: 4'-phosphopantetheinyl transferase superfamily protein [Bacteroidota bacterium]
MIYIYYAFISEKNHGLLLQKFLSNFPLDFQQKILSYRRWQDAQLSLLGRLLLSQGVLKNSQLKTVNSKILFNEYNKPYFEGKEINFNISHSGEIVVCAISETDTIGVDIEIINEININDFKSQMTTSEWNSVVYATDQQVAFYNYWTQKEAVVKTHGKGLSIPLQSFEINDNTTTIEAETFYTYEVDLEENYLCYVAYKQQIENQQMIIKKIAIQDILENALV